MEQEVAWKIYWEKLNFEAIGNFALTTKIISLSANVNNANINSNRWPKYRKNVATKKVFFKKMAVKFWNPNFNILCKTVFIFLIKCQPQFLGVLR